MNHLSEEQLSALADGGPALRAGAPAGEARTAAESHLESCAPCREALAHLLAQDHDLRGALEHDPGDAYFETFAARVGGRIRAAGLRGAQARVPEGRGLADWFRSPRKLALVGAVATVVVGAGIVMLSTREVTLPALRSRALESGAGPVAPMAEAPTPPPAEPPAAATDEARAPEAVTAAPPLAAAPPVTRSLAQREKGSAAPAPVREERPTAGAPMPASPEPRLMAQARPGAVEQSVAAPPTPEEKLASAEADGRAETAGGAVADRAAAPSAALMRTKQALGVAKEERTDEFAGQTTFTSLHGRNARRLTSLAEAMDRAPAWDSAAEEWAMALLGTRGTPLETETRYQLARARYRAWQAGATQTRVERAAAAFTGFLEMAPPGAQRDSVKVWLRRVAGDPAR